MCIFSTLHSTRDSYWLHKDGDTFSGALTHDVEEMAVVTTNQAPGVSIYTCLWRHLFKMLFTIFFFKTKPKPKAKTKELAPTRIFKPVLPRQKK